MAAGLLWILDASINISMEPFRAFVADILPEEQRTRGFAMQSLMIGLGAVLAYTLPWILHTCSRIVAPTATGMAIPFTVRLSFYDGRGGVSWAPSSGPSSPPRNIRPTISKPFARKQSEKRGLGMCAKS